ncbi:hypothetical protein EZS27_019813 [termite gut metagenome]|uniref:Core-binding (CB) domain-containing protein n=1 Tax=termite gut metagenome TaxID=433724 RepID=A0A5J4RD37_9ZZZZ
MATIHLTVLKQRQKSDGIFFVYIAVTHKRDVRYITTDYEVDDLFQFENGKVVCRKDAKIMNQRLQYVLSEYQEKLDKIEEQHMYNCAQIKEILEGKQEAERKAEQLITIKEYMERRIEQLQKEKRIRYATANKYTLSRFLSIVGDITLQSISPSTVEKFTRGMKELSNATQRMNLAHLKARLNEAVREGYIKYDIHPFAYIKMPKSNVRLLDLTIEEFNLIKNLDVKRKNIEEKKIRVARDAFLLSFYLGGINLIDLLQVNLSGDKITYIRQKTQNKKQGNKEVTFTIPAEAKSIIKNYIQKNGMLNFGYNSSYDTFSCYLTKCIKEMGKHLQIERRICYYSARKTFSQFAFDLGIRTEIIEYCIGQSMKENRPIYNYVRTTQRQADIAIRKVIDYTDDPTKFSMDVIVS